MSPAAINITMQTATQFYVHGTVRHCNRVSINNQQNATTQWFLHPSSGAQITVFTASGTSQPLLLPVAIMEELILSLSSSTVICAPDDGWRNHPETCRAVYR